MPKRREGPRCGKGWRYRIARALSECAQPYVDQAPDLDDPIWVLRLAERSKSDRLLATLPAHGELLRLGAQRVFAQIDGVIARFYYGLGDPRA